MLPPRIGGDRSRWHVGSDSRSGGHPRPGAIRRPKGGLAELGPNRDRPHRHAVPAACLLVLALILGANLLGIPIGAAPGPPRSSAMSLERIGGQPTSLNCSGSGLASLTVTPASVAVLPLQVQVFTATADDACGTPLGQNVTISWWLSSVSLGTLNSSAGVKVAYTACVAPMSGVLHARATAGAVTLWTNASISVSSHSSSGSGPPPSSSNGSLSGDGPSPGQGVPWGGIGIMAALLLGAGVVLFIGRRKGR